MVSPQPPASFTSTEPGTAAEAWRRHPRWGRGPALSLDGAARLVVLAAHPDDESLGAGGLVRTAVTRGLRVDLVLATDGEGSHPRSTTTSGADLARTRRSEAVEAARLLGVGPASLHHLGLPDGGVAGEEERLTGRLVALLGDARDVVVAAPWRHDGHPDHEAAGRAAAAACRRTGAWLWEYPVWFWHWGEPDTAPWEDWSVLSLDGEAQGAKQGGIAAHVSQVAPLSDRSGDEVLLGPDLLAHFEGPVEHFAATAGGECPDLALDLLHRREPDPWGVDSRWYERRRRALVLAALPRERFAHAVEVGCSTGALAQGLATRADRLLALDRSAAAVDAAQRRFSEPDPTGPTGSTGSVSVRRCDLPREWPDEQGLDLVVVSEVGYFLSPSDLEDLLDRIAASLAPDGVLVLAHWRHPVEGWPLDAAQVHAVAAARPGLPPVAARYVDRDCELVVHAPDDVWPDPQR